MNNKQKQKIIEEAYDYYNGCSTKQAIEKAVELTINLIAKQRRKKNEN